MTDDVCATFVTHSGFAHDVTGTDCWTQMAALIVVFWDFQTSISNKHSQTSSEKQEKTTTTKSAVCLRPSPFLAIHRMTLFQSVPLWQDVVVTAGSEARY